MAPPISSTPEEVFAACAAIVANGERLTLMRLRTELGGVGSPNRLTPLLRQWREAQHSSVPAEPVREISDTTALPPAIQSAIESLTASVAGAVAAMTPAFNEALAHAAETERRRARLEIDAAEIGAAAQIAEARDTADEERANTDLVRAEVTEREADVARLTSDLDTAVSEVARVEAEKAGVTDDLDAARQQIATEQVAALRLSETIAGLEAAAERAAMDLTRSVADAASAHARAEAAQAEAARAREGTEDLRGKLDAVREETAGLRTELAAAEAAHAEATRMLSELVDLRSKLDAVREETAGLRTEVAVATAREAAEARRAQRAEAEIERLHAQHPILPVAEAA
jgi:chromosome segregation ATPase